MMILKMLLLAVVSVTLMAAAFALSAWISGKTS